MKIQGIYKIINCINSKVYIGQSIEIEKRFKQHKINSKNNILYPLYNAIKCYGVDNFEFIIIEEVEDINKLDQREQYWMDHYKSYDRNFGYNLSPTAGGSKRGYKHSKETRDKISISNKGRIVTEETKEKIGLANKGKVSNRKGCKLSKEHKVKLLTSVKCIKQSEEHRKNLSISHTGKILTEAHKRNMAESHKGKKHSEETKIKLKEAWKTRKLKMEDKKETNLSNIIYFKQAV